MKLRLERKRQEASIILHLASVCWCLFLAQTDCSIGVNYSFHLQKDSGTFYTCLHLSSYVTNSELHQCKEYQISIMFLGCILKPQVPADCHPFFATPSLRVYKFLSYGHSHLRIGVQPPQAREINRSQKCWRQKEIFTYLV